MLPTPRCVLLNRAVNSTVEEIKAMILQLPVEELLALMAAIEERVETVIMMQLTETGFQEWNDSEENIYNDEA